MTTNDKLVASLIVTTGLAGGTLCGSVALALGKSVNVILKSIAVGIVVFSAGAYFYHASLIHHVPE